VQENAVLLTEFSMRNQLAFNNTLECDFWLRRF